MSCVDFIRIFSQGFLTTWMLMVLMIFETCQKMDCWDKVIFGNVCNSMVPVLILEALDIDLDHTRQVAKSFFHQDRGIGEVLYGRHRVGSSHSD